MAAKSAPKARSRRKINLTAIAPVLANVIYIDPKCSKEKNTIAYKQLLNDYLDQYTETEQVIALGYARLIFDNAGLIRKMTELCKVIPIPVGGKLSREV